MKITILGSGMTDVNKKRSGPSFLIETSKHILLFDCGWGTPLQLVRAGYDILDLDHIFISHPHADHMGTLLCLYQSMLVKNFSDRRRTKGIFLHGYQGFKADFKKLKSILLPNRIETFPVEISEHLNDAFESDGLKVETREVRHFNELFTPIGFKVTFEGKTVMYSGDTGYCEALVELAGKADIALVEAGNSPESYAQKGPNPFHLSPFECGEIARKAGTRRLILMHLGGNINEKAYIEAVRQHFAGETIVADDLKTIII